MAGKPGRPRNISRGTTASLDDPGGRMVRVKSMLENPLGMIDTGPASGPRSVKYGEEFSIREDLFSERWMEPLEEIDVELSRRRCKAARNAVVNDVVVGLRHDAAVALMAFGQTDEQVLKGMAAEPPLPMANSQ